MLSRSGLSWMMAVVVLTCLSVQRVSALTCHNHTEGFLFDGLIKRGVSNKTNAIRCNFGRTTPSSAQVCFEYARRKGSGPMPYGAGCGSRCPNGTNVICKLCNSNLCNQDLANDVRQKNLVCYTGPFLKGAMTMKRRRKIYCADDEKNCFIISWITDKIRTPKYFGGCGHQACSKKPGTVCTLTQCPKNLCNSSPAKRQKGCPATGCNGADTFPGNSGLLLVLALMLSVLAEHYVRA